MNQFKQICNLLGSRWGFLGLNSIAADFQPSLLLYFKVLTHHYIPSACFKCWRADFLKKKSQNKIQVSTCLKSHVLQSLVIQSKSRTEPCDKKVTIPHSEPGGWIITWGKGWECCFFVLNHSSSSMGTPFRRLESSQGASADPKSCWTIPPVNPCLG